MTRRQLTIKPSCMREIATFPSDRAALLWDKIDALVSDPLPDMRLGEVAFNLDRFLPLTTPDQDHHTDFWRWLMRAWLGDKRAAASLQKREREAAALVRERLVACGLAWMATQLDGALAVLQGDTPPPQFFVPGRQESWRITLSTLAALGQPQNGGASGAAAQQSRLIWSVQLDAGGRVTDITPWEQKHGARGWSKPKDVSLSKLAGNERLEPWDARVARAIQRDAYYGVALFSARVTAGDRALARGWARWSRRELADRQDPGGRYCGQRLDGWLCHFGFQGWTSDWPEFRAFSNAKIRVD